MRNAIVRSMLLVSAVAALLGWAGINFAASRTEPKPALTCPTSCLDGNACTIDSCDTTTGAWCDDGNSCTQADACDGSGHCIGTPQPVGASCDDGNSCTISDRCDDLG